MGGKRKTNLEAAAAAAAAAVAATQTESQEDLLELEAAEISEDLLEGLRRLEQGGNRITWYVYCDSGEHEGYVEKLRSDQLDENRFKTLYGPGEYRVFGKTADGRYVKGSHKSIKISDILAQGNGHGASDPAALFRELRATEEARAQARSAEWRGWAQAFAPVLGTLGAAIIARRPAIDIAALITALRPQQSTLAEMTTALVNLKSIQGDSGGGQLDVALKLLDRIQDLPSGGSDTGWLGLLRDVVREAAPHARELLAQRLPPQPSTGGSVSMVPLAAPAFPRPAGAAAPANGATAAMSAASAPLPSSPPAPSTPTDPGAHMWLMLEPWLRRRAEDVHEWASNNLEGELCAEMLLASVPKPFRAFVTPQELVGYLQREDWWTVLVGFHPPLAPYQSWIDDMRQQLLQMLDDEIRGDSGEPPPEHLS